MPRRKRKEYAIALAMDGRASTERGHSQTFADEWTPEHLVLAALARCVVTSLRHHARRGGCEARATAHAAGAVFERADGTWGFVDLECRIEATVEPPLDGDGVRDLVGRAQRGCFIGSSLRPHPVYSWCINGAEIA